MTGAVIDLGSALAEILARGKDAIQRPGPPGRRLRAADPPAWPHRHRRPAHRGTRTALVE